MHNKTSLVKWNINSNLAVHDQGVSTISDNYQETLEINGIGKYLEIPLLKHTNNQYHL